jgi:hypothetical protein
VVPKEVSFLGHVTELRQERGHVLITTPLKSNLPAASTQRAGQRDSQWDDGFTPSRGIRCEVAGDAHARRR